MTHDFAKKNKATSKKKKTRKNQVPGWVWLFTGIVTGVFISFLGYLTDIAPEATPEQLTTKASKEKPKAETKKSSATRFDFYTLLPELEVIVPTEQDDEDAEPTQATLYILQAGSFKNADDADRLRAQLILMGLDANIDAVEANGDLWHRVQVGPFESRSQLAKTRNILISKGIDTLLLKRKVDR
ncbi:MAG: SPOR domain-containing protein [Pseudomonadales bacterium]